VTAGTVLLQHAALAEPLAFPGAVGFGASATGWRGGKIVAVSTLENDGPGSLRDCAEGASMPRICVLSVSGTIELDDPIRVGSNVYIAGQTAPGDGIQIRLRKATSSPFILQDANDVVVRFLKLRPGPGSTPTATVDAITLENSSRIYLGNLSLMFATDENFNVHVSGKTSADITLERSIVAYGLDRANHPDGRHSKGALICSKEGTGSACGRVTLWGNLFAHNRDRNPDVNGTGIGPVEVVNNVFYNPISQFGELYDHTGDLSLAYVGNVAIAGPDTTDRAGWVIEAFDFHPENSISIFAQDNRGLRTVDCEFAGSFPILDPLAESYATATPPGTLSVEPLPADDVIAFVRSVAGDRIAGRREADPLDARVLWSLKNCKGGVIDRVEQAGGWPEIARQTRQDSDADGLPDDWERSRPELDPAQGDDVWATDTRTGLSFIEAYLAEAAGDLPPS
jgi:pectate lyase